MEARQVAALIVQADRCRRSRDWHGAIGLLKRALALEPEHAGAHASLALALLGARRLRGAALEVELALAFDGDDRFCHYAAAAVRRAERDLGAAWEHCLVVLQDDDSDADARVLAASIRGMQGERDEARKLLGEALAADAEHVDALCALASLDLGDGKILEARRWIERALAADPSAVEAHVVAGYIELRSDNVAEAEGHARFALNSSAAERDALELWTAIKARRSFWLGLWWQFNTRVALRSERARVGVLIGSYVLVRLAIIITGVMGYEDLEEVIAKVWLGFCAYTWLAPALFRRMLKRELGTVRLREDY